MNNILRLLFKRKHKDNILEKNIKNIKKIKVENFKFIFSSDRSLLRVASFCDTLQEYTILINELFNLLKKEEIIRNNNFPNDINILPVHMLFINVNGNYCDPCKTLTEFLIANNALFICYNDLERRTNNNFTTISNLRITQNIINNLINITEVFMKIK